MDTITTSIEVAEWLPFLLQTADPLFPTGGYAHSLGGEEMARLGVIRDEASLLSYLHLHTLPMLAHQELPYLRYAIGAVGDAELLQELNGEIGAWKLAQEARVASEQIGTRRLRALENIRPGESPMESAHHLIAFAQQAALAGMPERAALITWAYQALAAVCAAALKLIRIGQDGIQRVLRCTCLEIPETVEKSFAIEREAAGWFSPMLEIASMRHARADERLFIS